MPLSFALSFFRVFVMELIDAAATSEKVPSAWRAWFALIAISMRRQARAHWMVIVSLGLLALSALLVYLNTSLDRWNMVYWRSRRSPLTYGDAVLALEAVGSLPWPAPLTSLQLAASQSYRAIIFETSGLTVFSRWIVFALFATFLFPLWSLTFATEALGREREAQNLIWTLLRPIPRPAVYLAKYLAALPYALAFNLGGFFVLCVFAGQLGLRAFGLYWPAVLLGTLAFVALFHLMGACLRRPGVVALLYAFFLETIAGNLPGHFKRLSISFYTRCLMFDSASEYGIGPNNPAIYLPVSGAAALTALITATVVLLLAGMVVFSRSEYLDVR
jgi:ABC-2 type transport system permease protein